MFVVEGTCLNRKPRLSFAEVQGAISTTPNRRTYCTIFLFSKTFPLDTALSPFSISSCHRPWPIYRDYLSSHPRMDTEAILSDPNFELITTLLYSVGFPPPPPHSSLAQAIPPLSRCYLLQYGIDRLLRAAADFGWSPLISNLDQPGRAASLAKQIEAHVVETHKDAALDPSNRFIVRIAYKRDGVLSLMSAPRPTIPGVQYFPLSLLPPDVEPSVEAEIPIIPVHLDPGHVKASLFTKHKTSYRGEYNEARARVGFNDTVAFTMGEMLLQNERGEITGGGVTSVYFWRQGKWIAPAAETGCKLGVSRRWALENAGVKEGIVMAKDVQEGEIVWLSSAVGGFRRGMVTLKRREARG